MKIFTVALLLAYTNIVIAVRHQEDHHSDFDHGSPSSQTDLDHWADSLIVDEPAVVDDHQHPSSLPTHPPLHHQSSLNPNQVVEKSTSYIDPHGSTTSSGYNANYIKWIESVLMNDDDEPGHTTEHIPSSKTPPNIFSPSASSGLSSAGLSININRKLKDNTTPPGPYSPKPYKQRWTLDYKKLEVKRVHDAVDAMVMQRFGPSNSKSTLKRRYNLLRRLSKEKIDDLAKGRTIDLPKFRKYATSQQQQQQKLPKTDRRHWTKGFNRSDMAAINNFIEGEILPSRKGESTTLKNNLIRRLSSHELRAIVNNDQIEKKKIVERFVQWKEVSVASRNGGRSKRRQKTREA